jgi:hypothetical protein
VNWRLYVCYGAVGLEVCNLVRILQFPYYKSVARRRLVKSGNPSACATMSWKMCKSAIALYCLYLSVIKRECVTEVLINQIIRTRTRQFVARTTLHVTVLCQKWLFRNPMSSQLLATSYVLHFHRLILAWYWFVAQCFRGAHFLKMIMYLWVLRCDSRICY